MASDPLFVLVILSMAVVAIVLLTGIGGFGRGGEFNKKYANKIEIIRQTLSIQGVENIPFSIFLIGNEFVPSTLLRIHLQSSIHRIKLHFSENGFNTKTFEQSICARPYQSRSAVNVPHNQFFIKYIVDNICVENVYQILLEEGLLKN